MQHTTGQLITKDNTTTFVASTKNPDRQGDIINQSGWDLGPFKDNPVILFAHDTKSIPVGQAKSIQVKGGKLVADIDFLPPGIDEFADKVKILVEKKFLRAVSVGLTPTDMEPRFNKDGYFIGHKINKQILNELSIVPVPANAEALAVAKSLDFTQSDLDTLLIKPDKKELSRYQHRLNKARAGVRIR